MFYDKFIYLCNQKGVSPSKAAVDAGISKSLVTKWKANNVKLPSPDVLKRLSDYFGIPVSDLIEEENKKTPALTTKDERDIAKNLEAIMADLAHSGDLMFDGDPMSDEARESMRNAIELGLKAVKLLNKETYTPKKYKKG